MACRIKGKNLKLITFIRIFCKRKYQQISLGIMQYFGKIGHIFFVFIRVLKFFQCLIKLCLCLCQLFFCEFVTNPIKKFIIGAFNRFIILMNILFRDFFRHEV